jgi:hypothetical protein
LTARSLAALVPGAPMCQSPGKKMAFILAVLLFVVVVGIIDAGLPWPDPKSDSHLP